MAVRETFYLGLIESCFCQIMNPTRDIMTQELSIFAILIGGSESELT